MEEADSGYILKSLEDFAHYNRHVYPGKEPVLLKVFFPHVASEYFKIKYEDNPLVRSYAIASPESASTIEIAKQITEKGLQAVQIFRRKSTVFYQWDPKTKLITRTFLKKSFEEWIKSAKIDTPEGLHNVFPDYCQSKIALAKQWPHPYQQLKVMVDLVATLWVGLKDNKEYGPQIEALAQIAHQMVIISETYDFPDDRSPPAVFEACWNSLDKTRDSFLESLKRSYERIVSPHFRSVLKYLGFVMWQFHGFRSADDPESIRRVKHLNGKYKIYCSITDKFEEV